MSDIVLNKDFLNEDVFLKIKSTLLSNNFPWFYNSFTGNINDRSNFLFYHYLFKDNLQESDFFNLILVPILSKLDCSFLIIPCVSKQTPSDLLVCNESLYCGSFGLARLKLKL